MSFLFNNLVTKSCFELVIKDGNIGGGEGGNELSCSGEVGALLLSHHLHIPLPPRPHLPSLSVSLFLDLTPYSNILSRLCYLVLLPPSPALSFVNFKR